MISDAALEALGHATSGSLGTAISTTTLYPLDLVTTRLKAQRLGREKQKYDGVIDALKKTVEEGGGVSALYNGIGPDLAKSIVDSFLFFGIYNYLSKGSGGRRNMSQELAIGAIAGACARFWTTPLSNVVTRKQTASDQESVGTTIRSLLKEGGWSNLWAGYSATLVLTLNPSITFVVHRRLARRIIPAVEDGDIPIAWVTFLLAAVSKAMATALTFPFQAGKTRLQMGEKGKDPKHKYGSHRDIEKESEEGNEPRSQMARLLMWSRALLSQSIWGVIITILRTEGVRSLYAGLRGELLKSVFSHGITMLTKGLIHRTVIRLWFVIAPRLRQRRLSAK